MKPPTQRLQAVRSGQSLAVPCIAYGFQLDDGAVSLWWVLPAAIVFAGLAYFLGRRMAKRRSEPATIAQPSPAPQMPPTVTAQAGPTPPNKPAAFQASTSKTEMQTTNVPLGKGRFRAFGLASPNALYRWWVRIPAHLRRYSPLLSVAWADGIYLTAWPRLAMLLPLGALVLGCIVGATHWSPFVIGDGNVTPTGSFVVFTQSLPFILLATAIGVLSANTGLMLVIGYAFGDYLLAGPQLVRNWPPPSLPLFFYVRFPLLICYGLLFMLAVLPCVSTRPLLLGLMRKVKGGDLASQMVRILVTAGVQAAFVYAWTLAAPMIMRVVWLWAGGSSSPVTVAYYQNLTIPWLPLSAVVATVARGFLTDRSLLDINVRDRLLQLHKMLKDADRHLAFSRRMPLWLRAIATAAALTILIAGLMDSLVVGLIIFVGFAVLLIARALVAPKLPFWKSWSILAQKVPLVVRLAAAVLATFFLTRGALALSSQSGLNTKAGAFGTELWSTGFGLLFLLILIPEERIAPVQWAGDGARADALPMPRQFSKTITLLAGAALVLSAPKAYAICADQTCCFVTYFLAALAVAAIIILFWPIIGIFLVDLFTALGGMEILLAGRGLIMAGFFFLQVLLYEAPEEEEEAGELADVGARAIQAAADAAEQGATRGAAAGMSVGDETFTDLSSGAAQQLGGAPTTDALNPSVRYAVDSVPSELRVPFAGKCAEMGCLSQALDAGVNVAGGRIAAARIPDTQPLPPCPTCACVLQWFGVRF